MQKIIFNKKICTMKKFTYQIVTLILAVSVVLPGLSVKAQKIKGNKNVVKEERAVKNFRGIDVGGAFNVFIEQAGEQNLLIEADENLLGKIKTVVRDEILFISSSNIKNATKLNVYIKTPGINFIDASGASTVKSSDILKSDDFFLKASGATRVTIEIKTGKLESEVSGAADVDLSGFADNFNIEASGAANLDAGKLETKISNVRASGAANVTIYATDELISETSGAGNIKVKGEPSVSNIIQSSSKSKKKYYKDVTVTTYKTYDTTTVKVGGMTVQVIEGDSTKISVGNRVLIVDDYGNVKFRRSRKHKFNGHWAGVGLGINGYVDKNFKNKVPDEYDFLDLRYEKSIELNVNILEQNFNLAGNKFGLVTGIGLRWNNYRFNNNVVLVSDSSTIYGFRDDKENYRKSKLVVNYLTIPLLLEFQTNRFSRNNSFHITGGMIMGIRYRTHSKRVYDKNGKVKPKDFDSFHLNPFRWDVNLRLGWGIINLYANYSLNTLFKEDEGPELYPFSIGLTLVGW